MDGVAKFEIFLTKFKLCNQRTEQEQEQEGSCDRSLQLAYSMNLSTTQLNYILECNSISTRDWCHNLVMMHHRFSNNTTAMHNSPKPTKLSPWVWVMTAFVDCLYITRKWAANFVVTLLNLAPSDSWKKPEIHGRGKLEGGRA